MASSPRDRKSVLIAALRRDVLTMRLKPGEALDETSLAERFGLSRTPLREVFRLLAGEGYLTLEDNRGARAAEMTHKNLRDFFLAAPMVYAAILRLAAENAEGAQIEALKSAQVEFRAALRQGAAAERALANTRFHDITGEMADNVYLAPSLRRLLIDHARIGMTFYRPRDPQMVENLSRASEQHDAMIGAIEAGDADAAGALAIDHWNLSRNRIEMFVTPQSLHAPLGSAMRSA